MNGRGYGEALYGAVQDGVKVADALLRLKTILEQNGHSSLYGEALRYAHARFLKDEEGATVRVTLAREEDQKVFAKEIQAFVGDASKTEVVIDENIVGGFMARNATAELDQSYKKSLLSIYQSLIA